MGLRGCIALVALAALVLASSGCSGERQTQIIVGVATDLVVPKEIDHLVFHVTYVDEPTKRLVDHSWNLDPDVGDAIQMPARLALTAGERPERTLRIRVAATKSGREIVDRVAMLSFARDRVVFLSLNLLRQCVPIACGAGRTCGERGCEDVQKDATKLVDYSKTVEQATHDAGVADAFYQQDLQLKDAPIDRPPDGGRDAYAAAALPPARRALPQAPPRWGWAADEPASLAFRWAPRPGRPVPVSLSLSLGTSAPLFQVFARGGRPFARFGLKLLPLQPRTRYRLRLAAAAGAGASSKGSAASRALRLTLARAADGRALHVARAPLRGVGRRVEVTLHRDARLAVTKQTRARAPARRQASLQARPGARSALARARSALARAAR